MDENFLDWRLDCLAKLLWRVPATDDDDDADSKDDGERGGGQTWHRITREEVKVLRGQVV